jgi:peptide/nickel transport system substrate-binding protein
MDANDGVYSLIRSWRDCPRGYVGATYPYNDYIESITAPDKWTVIVKGKPGKLGITLEFAGAHVRIVPPEAIEMYGDLGKWENAVGTGPWVLMDYVAGSSLTYDKNPDYWMNDPLHPANQLPYADVFKILIIPDNSTRMAAMRTGKIDLLVRIPWEDGRALLQSSPELKYDKSSYAIWSTLDFRVDKPELPWYDLRVRRALCMAFNNQEMADTYYGGEVAQLTGGMVADVPDFSDMYTPLDELPEEVREIYEYHPDKAKQLLTEAGYPNGFKVKVLCHAVGGAYPDMLSIVKAYWEKIGVELEMDITEYGSYVSRGYARDYDTYMTGIGGVWPFIAPYWRSGSLYNFSIVNDPYFDGQYEEMMAAHYIDEPKARQIGKELNVYCMSQAYAIEFPTPLVYTFWQPWLKQYSGEYMCHYNYVDFPKYVWIDQDLKYEMTGKR